MLEPIGSKFEVLSLPPPPVAPVATAPPRKERKGVYSRRISVARIGAYINELEQYTRRTRLQRLLVSAGVIGTIALLLALLVMTRPEPPEKPVALVVGVVFAALGLLMFSFWFFSWRATQKQIAVRRLQPLGRIVTALREDLLPTRKLRVRYDLRAPNHKQKMTWAQTSGEKVRYYDAWLRLRGMLAEGTRFRVKMNSELKTKKGRIMHEKRWLFLKLMPPAARYSIDQAAEHFHELVSAFDQEPALSGSAVVLQIAIDQLRGAIVIKARREDQDFRPEAVLGILRGTMHFLIKHGREQPGQEVA
ncbi:MAG TPA: hypothetical protein VNM90_09380 [Haliangium sp.]|nr:hypothetical protein [Haliangium sp.]